jgi:hypothetical protein
MASVVAGYSVDSVDETNLVARTITLPCYDLWTSTTPAAITQMSIFMISVWWILSNTGTI